jgi:DNA helicase II / ATP-dependent DNA helicase PcrA
MISFTSQQKSIMLWGVEGTGHAVVVARAGTGKTFTALELVRLLIPATSLAVDRRLSITLAMFNADIKDETNIKINKDGLAAKAVTFHGAGWTSLLRAYPQIKLSGVGPGLAGFDKWDRIVEKLDIPQVYQSFARKAVSMAKQRAFGLAVKMSDPIEWLKIVEDFDLDASISAEFLDSGLKPREDIIKEGLQWAFKALKASNEMLTEVADHDDQIYGPLIRDLKMWESDWLIIDEAQDTNPARRLLARKMVKRNGRTMWIGDPKQSIYAFTGADSNAMDIITKEWHAVTLKLTTTFRCPKVVVRLAQQFVPDFEAGATNIEGTYQTVANDEFFKTVAATLSAQKPGSDAHFVEAETIFLCRNTAPLVKSAFRLIAQGIACHVEGKDIGAQITELVNRWKSVKTLRTLRDRLNAYKESQHDKLMKAGKTRQAESLTDRVETVFAVIEGLPQNASLDDLKAKVGEMFQKTPKGERAPKRIRLMTLHRSKGLEAKTIVFLGRQELIPSKYATKPEQLAQEDNLAYVGITRSMERLIEVRL